MKMYTLRNHGWALCLVAAATLTACGGSGDGGDGDGSGDAICGNAIVETGEACDDGNLAADDGCDACLVVDGWACEGAPSVCTEAAACGDGVIGDGETCDDGNTAADDGCSADCATEDGYTCVGEPSVCTTGGDPCADVDCSALDDGCTVGVCDAGDCVAQPADDGTACDDGSSCTSGDVCGEGVCGGTELDCSALDDGCSVGVCDAETGACAVVALDDGASCDDGDGCTQGDVCSAGTCAGATLDCSALDGACGAGACDSATGECVVVAVADGETCDDGMSCTTDDTCSAGVCGGTTVVCEASGPCYAAACSEDTGACEQIQLDDGTECDDGAACTRSDVCAAGVCVGAARDCSGLDGECSTGMCDEATGSCIAVDVADGSACDDGDLCTSGEVCAAGTCAGPALDCSSLDGECSVGVCDPATGACGAEPLADGAACDDGDLCTDADICVGGSCGGRDVPCGAAGDGCNVGMCDPATGSCVTDPRPNGSACTDFDGCTDGDTCQDGACVPGAAVSCPAPDDACMVAECDPRTGSCLATAVADGVSCDVSADDCVVQTCSAGTCVSVPRTDTAICDDDPTDCVALFCVGGTCEYQPVLDCTPCGDGTQLCGGGVCGGVRAETIEGFESGSIPREYVNDELAPWTVDLATAAAGTFSARSGVVGNLGESVLSVDVFVEAGSMVSFGYRVDAEVGDELRFSIDGAVITSFTGDTGWQSYSTTLDAGARTLTWTWARDAAGSAGADRAWLDDVSVDNVDPCFGDVCQQTVFSGTSCVLCDLDPAGTVCDVDPNDCQDQTCDGTGRCLPTNHEDCSSCGDDGGNLCAGGVCGGTAQTTFVRFNSSTSALPAGFSSSGESLWTLSDQSPRQGTRAAMAGPVSILGASRLEWPVTMLEDGTVTFYYRVPVPGDQLTFRTATDGEPVVLWSTVTNWTLASIDLAAGDYTLVWDYTESFIRDESIADYPGIDDLRVTGLDRCGSAACSETLFDGSCLFCPQADGIECLDGDAVGTCAAGECSIP